MDRNRRFGKEYFGDITGAPPKLLENCKELSGWKIQPSKYPEDCYGFLLNFFSQTQEVALAALQLKFALWPLTS